MLLVPLEGVSVGMGRGRIRGRICLLESMAFFHSSCINCCYSKVFFGKALRQISEVLEN